MIYEKLDGSKEIWDWTHNTRKYISHIIKWNWLKLTGQIHVTWECGTCHIEVANQKQLSEHICYK